MRGIKLVMSRKAVRVRSSALSKYCDLHEDCGDDSRLRHFVGTRPTLRAVEEAADCHDARELLFLCAFGIVIIVPSEARGSGAAATDS
jgi:hypothetical protein